MVEAAYYQELLRPIFNGRRVVIVGMPLAGATHTVKQLRSLGSERVLIIASGPGTGPVPEESDAEWIVLRQHALDIVAELHEVEDLMASPPAAVIESIERYDPDRKALVLAPAVTLGPIPDLMAGRPVWGRRPPASLPLEEKTTIDAFWDRIGLERAPSVIAPVSIDAIIGAHRRMDRGAGTVMAGDARDGLHGGSHLVRWIRNDDDLRQAIEAFGQHCDRLRIMPFLEGIPCSIHGLVFADSSAVLRPVELVTLRPRGGFRFLYAGAATYWDPPTPDREYMRSVGRRVADAYRKLVGMGCFTVDGVLTAEGWLPTELNPRFGAGISVMAHGLPEMPLILLCQALQAGEALHYRPAQFEKWLLSAADSHRSGGGWTTTNTRFDTSQEYQLVRSGESYRLATASEAADGTLLLGPSNVGGFIRFTADPARTEIGPSIAPAVVAAFALGDREFGTNIGPVDPARPARS
jgi:hypothetical protein